MERASCLFGRFGETGGLVPDDKQAAVPHRNVRRFAGKMVADAQRKTAGKYAVFQSVIQPPLCHAPGIRAHAEDGQVSAQSRREGNAAVLYHGDDRPVACEIAHGAPVGEKLQRLEIGHGVVKPGAVQTSVK